MKKFLAVLLSGLMVLSLAACSNGGDSANGDASKVKVGMILIGDENEGYTYAHIKGAQDAAKTLGMSEDQILWKYTVSEDATCYDAAADLVDSGCNVIVTNSYGHQTYAQQAAKDFPDVTVVAMTGDTAKTSELKNFKNAFTNVYESRYVSGVVAGMKVAELVKDGKLADNNYDEDGNVKIGYVGAYPYAEVVSGFTAFYLGIKSVVENVSMEVKYTNSWFDITAEGEAANALIADGCVIIGQHADSTGAPSAVQAALEKGTVAYSVGYNVDMLSVAPDAALTSATNNWSAYYEYLFKSVMDGTEVKTDWAEGYNSGAVATTDLGKSCAEGTADKVAEVEKAIKDGSLHVFDTSKFTVNGEAVTSCLIDMNGDYNNDDQEAISDGYFHESTYRAAPSFYLIVDGIKVLAD